MPLRVVKWQTALFLLLLLQDSVEGGGVAPLVLLVVSKMFITMSFLVVYVQCAEIYPTTHRASGTGLSSLVSSCFGVTAPYIAYIAEYGHWLPYFVLFIIGLLGCICASFLPETLDVDLPQSLQDAKSFLTSEKYWSYEGRSFRSAKLKVTRTGQVNPASPDPANPDKT